MGRIIHGIAEPFVLFRQYDVTSSQMDLLDYLDQREQKAASQKEIVDYLQISYATVSGNPLFSITST